jgi:hypothetical protein
MAITAVFEAQCAAEVFQQTLTIEFVKTGLAIIRTVTYELEADQLFQAS